MGISSLKTNQLKLLWEPPWRSSWNVSQLFVGKCPNVECPPLRGGRASDVTGHWHWSHVCTFGRCCRVQGACHSRRSVTQRRWQHQPSERSGFALQLLSLPPLSPGCLSFRWILPHLTTPLYPVLLLVFHSSFFCVKMWVLPRVCVRLYVYKDHLCSFSPQQPGKESQSFHC